MSALQQYFKGTQRVEGAPLTVDFKDPTAVGAIDWASFVPSAVAGATGRAALKVAPTAPQVYTMARTLSTTNQVAGPVGRRTMVAWLQDNTLPASSMSLPRDLSLDPSSGALLQAFIPELQQLRLPATDARLAQPQQVPLPRGRTNSWSQLGHDPAQSWPRGATLELLLVWQVPAGVSGHVGVRLLADASLEAEYTDLGIDLGSQLVFINRTMAGSSGVKDTRAGPLLLAGDSRSVQLHAYVDHSVVTCIVNNRTAVTAFVHPSAANHTRVALFNTVTAPGVLLTRFASWQLQAATTT